MKVIRARNVNEALPLGLFHIREMHRAITPRDAATLEYPEPVCTVFRKPQERVMFDPRRDANPFFHLMEALWILAGRKDVEWIARYNAQIANYSDDGKSFHAAYGYRLKDQIEPVIDLLIREPHTRRAVLQIWDSQLDLNHQGKDIPCNSMVFLKIRDDKLHISVANRSNDIIWGAYGANAVQFSMIQEYLAGRLDVGVGEYRQVSDSYHVYTEGPGKAIWDKCSDIEPAGTIDPYKWGTVEPYPFMTEPAAFDDDLQMFMGGGVSCAGDAFYHNAFFEEVAEPMVRSWGYYKLRQFDCAISEAETVQATDWQLACVEWLERRAK